ncbi:ABC transporter permease [Streptomyces sp. NPDC001903]|uniref:ABC transporter permease n=1 Tax=Streptomyces sp. NPDC001903 TaxID=3364622 RepID=UPI00368A737E
MNDLLRRCLVTVRTGGLLYTSANPVRVQLVTDLPRILLQAAFLIMLGRTAGGVGAAADALTGAAAFAVSSLVVVGLCDVPMDDEWSGTQYRIQTGVLPPVLVHLCRALPHPLAAIVAGAAVLAVDGPLLGLGATSAALVPAAPLYLLMALSSSGFGLAVAVLAVGRRADVLFGNLAAYLVLALTGVLAPRGAGLPWLVPVADALPVSHGLRAVRALVDHRPWAVQASLEAAVGIGWLLVAVLLARWRMRVLRRPRPRPRPSRPAGTAPLRGGDAPHRQKEETP